MVDDDACNGMGSYDPPIPTASVLDGRAELAPGDLQVRGDLGMAWVKARVQFRPWGSPATFPIDLDLTWRAVDEVATYKDQFRWRFPDGAMTILHTLSTTRRADASGTISNGTVDYGGTQLGSATISMDKRFTLSSTG